MRFALLLISAACAAVAQTPAPRPERLVSPEIKAGGTVTFRFRAARPSEVAVRGQWSKTPIPMSRGEDGLWVAESVPVPAGIWEYSFAVDGLSVVDPANPAIKPAREVQKNLLQIPADPPAPWDLQNVPHGTVHEHIYASKSLGRTRSLRVYTPPGYERETARQYPLLVLLHGSGDNERTWTEAGKAHWILDNLIAEQKAQPMIVVMLNGHAREVAPKGDPALRAAAMDAFRRDLLEDALPLIESLYRVERDANRRAITGLSMGGGQSLTIGLEDLSRFAWVGGFSAGLPSEDVLQKFVADPAAANSHLRLLWIGVGKDDFLKQRNEEFVTTLKDKGIHHEWRLTDGDHSWPVWRRYLAEFVPLLFTDRQR